MLTFEAHAAATTQAHLRRMLQICSRKRAAGGGGEEEGKEAKEMEEEKGKEARARAKCEAAVAAPSETAEEDVC